MKSEFTKEQLAKPQNTNWAKLSEVPFAGENKNLEQPKIELFDSKTLPLSSDPKKRLAQEKFLRNEPLSILEKAYDRDGASIITEIENYKLKSDHAYRVVSEDLYQKYIQDGFITRDIEEYIAGQNNGGVDWFLGGAAKKYGDKKNRIVIIECPADKNYFSLTVDNGNNLTINPNIRHIKSSSRTNPIPIEKITNVFHIDLSHKKLNT